MGLIPLQTCVIEVNTGQDRGGGGGCCGGGGGGGNFSDNGNANIRRGGRNQDHGAAKIGGGRQNDGVPVQEADITGGGGGGGGSGGGSGGGGGGGGGNKIQGGGHHRGIDREADANGGGNDNRDVGEKAEGGAYMNHTASAADAESSATFINEPPRHEFDSVKAYRYARPPSAINFAPPAAPVVNSYVHSFGEGINRGCTIM